MCWYLNSFLYRCVQVEKEYKSATIKIEIVINIPISFYVFEEIISIFLIQY